MLVIPEKRKLVVNTSDPAGLLAVLPHAKAVPHDGETLVAMPYGVDESLVLRNLGYSVPAPIHHYYSWPARFAPMDHQKETSAFLTTHKRALVLNAPGCVDADTEYLSPSGWVRIADYTGGLVAQFDPANDEVTFVDAEYVKLPCDHMVQVKTKYGVDQLLSPEHRCLIYSKHNPDKREVLEAAELYRRERDSIRKSRNTIAFSQAAIKTTFAYRGAGFPLSIPELRVQVAVIADGYFPSSTKRCLVRVKKDRKKLRLRSLLDEAGILYTERPVAPEGFSLFTFVAPRREKEFSSTWLQCDAAQLSAVVDEVRYWDSNVPANPNRGWRFSTYAKVSADFVQFACASQGHTARVLVAQRERRGRLETEYTVQVRPDVRVVGLQGGSSTEITTAAVSPDGYKYCFMVPSTFLLLRRNGCVFTTGNTGKTISSIWAADFLLEQGAARKVLIVGPLSTLKTVWGRELRQHLPHRSFVICTGSKQKRQQLLEQPGIQYVIINHDGFTNMQSYLKDFDVVIYDEATALKTPGSQRYKIFAKWAATHQPWLWLLTGTPISQTPADAWTLAKLVGSPTVPRSYTTFKDMVMQKVSTFRWTPRPDALEICKKVLQPSIRFALDECKDLPPTNYVGRKTELTPTQVKAFKEMKDKAVTVFSSGEEVTAANAAVMLGKLLQISCIAYNTDVLTDKGWLPIQTVTPEHRVWDGEEWVSQGGAMYRGYKALVGVEGVRMTGDHLVWLDRWIKAQEIVDADASSRFDRPTVRLPDGFAPGEACYDKVENGAVGVLVRLWDRSRAAEPIPAGVTQSVSSKLWVSPRKRVAQTNEDPTLSNLDWDAAPVLRPEGQGLSELRRAWGSGLPAVARVVREFLGRHGQLLRTRTYAGPRGQRRSVLARELPVGFGTHTVEQQTDQHLARYPSGADDGGTSCGSLRRSSGHTVRTTEQVQVAADAGADRVYDLLNCGPRNRFVVRGASGRPLVVHNCGVVYSESDEIAIDASERYNTLTELLEEIGDKVIVFCPLRGVQDFLQKALLEDGYDVASVHGSVSKADRDKIFHDFQHTDSIRVLLAHPKVAAHGLTLTRAKDIIWFAPIYSLEQYEQANARIRRLTTVGKTTVWHIWATSFEAELYRRLRAKQNTLADFLNLVNGINED